MINTKCSRIIPLLICLVMMGGLMVGCSESSVSAKTPEPTKRIVILEEIQVEYIKEHIHKLGFDGIARWVRDVEPDEIEPKQFNDLKELLNTEITKRYDEHKENVELSPKYLQETMEAWRQCVFFDAKHEAVIMARLDVDQEGITQRHNEWLRQRTIEKIKSYKGASQDASCVAQRVSYHLSDMYEEYGEDSPDWIIIKETAEQMVMDATITQFLDDPLSFYIDRELNYVTLFLDGHDYTDALTNYQALVSLLGLLESEDIIIYRSSCESFDDYISDVIAYKANDKPEVASKIVEYLKCISPFSDYRLLKCDIEKIEVPAISISEFEDKLESSTDLQTTYHESLALLKELHGLYYHSYSTVFVDWLDEQIEISLIDSDDFNTDYTNALELINGLDEAYRETSLEGLVTSTRFTFRRSLLNNDIKKLYSILDTACANEQAEQYTFFKGLRPKIEALEALMMDCTVVHDDFDMFTKLCYEGVEKVTKSRKVVPSTTNNTIDLRMGFYRENWLFVDNIKIKADDTILDYSFDEVDRIVHKNNTISETAIKSFWGPNEDELLSIIHADKVLIRFESGVNSEYVEHTLTSSEKAAIEAIYAVYTMKWEIFYLLD